MPVLEKSKIVFIGDSTTDTGRREDRQGIGYGYVRLLRDYLLTEFHDSSPEIINMGTNGNRITDLAARWKRDVIEQEPDFVSISIGINDVWRQLDQPEMEQVYPDRFHEIYRQLLDLLKSSAVIPILMEPTIIEEHPGSLGNQKLKPYVEITRQLAVQYDGFLVPTHQKFTAFLIGNHKERLTTDGVHMTSLGNMLMAKTWLQAVVEH
ncbi:SGNH/GDSL hydrolase family protein [Sediminibacillus halophilus]|uniref:Lysophospholipase L1 n=1 Tax=Sediminibacillus halophilus TaxID=482461 RepID=A0A1G9X1A1_9BACI|nr:SGNH/GDSL hydrolase family protein [Sediminibacillus halophilus]SDM90301.1 Lysophospholipase L1 [Sediminibacillus halophilus]